MCQRFCHFNTFFAQLSLLLTYSILIKIPRPFLACSWWGRGRMRCFRRFLVTTVDYQCPSLSSNPEKKPNQRNEGKQINIFTLITLIRRSEVLLVPSSRTNSRLRPGAQANRNLSYKLLFLASRFGQNQSFINAVSW